MAEHGQSENVIALRQRTPDDDAPVRTRKAKRAPFCRHLQVELDHNVRRVFCADCKAEVPAFDALHMLAHEFERWTDHRDRAEREARAAQTTLDDLKRQVRNAKAQLRRAS